MNDDNLCAVSEVTGKLRRRQRAGRAGEDRLVVNNSVQLDKDLVFQFQAFVNAFLLVRAKYCKICQHGRCDNSIIKLLTRFSSHIRVIGEHSPTNTSERQLRIRLFIRWLSV